MAKRQKIASTAPSGVVPRDLIAFNKPSADPYDAFTVLYPAQQQPITVGSTLQKITIDLPNIKSLRFNQIMLDVTLTPGFTSTSGSDNFGNINPQFVGVIGSIIDRFTINVGSTTLCDVYGNSLRYQLQYWMRSNSITQLDDQYLFPSGLAPAEGVSQNVRFPLVFDDSDFPNLKNGFLPLGLLGQRVSIDLYFAPAPNVMFYSQASPNGTITLNYTVSNLRFKVEEMTSDMIRTALASSALPFSYDEWYQQSVPIVANSQNLVIPVPNNFRWVSKIIMVVRKTSDITAFGSTTANKLKLFTADMSEVVKANLRYQGQLRYAEPLVGSIDMLHELKKVCPYVRQSSYFSDITTLATTHAI
jgi:hypothetical protein